MYNIYLRYLPRSHSLSIVLRQVTNCWYVLSNRCNTTGAWSKIFVTLSPIARILDLFSAMVFIRLSFSLSISPTRFSSSSIASFIVCTSNDLKCRAMSPGGRLQSNNDSNQEDIHRTVANEDFPTSL